MLPLRKLSAAVLLLAFALTGASSAGDSKAAGNKPVVAPCVKYWGEARGQAYGFKHVVHLDNQCPKPASCDVSTDVSPEVQKVSLAKDERIEVVTYLESTVANFVPKVVCTM